MCMGSGLCCGWLHAMYNVLAILSMTDVVCLACMQKLLSPCMSSAGSVWYVWVCVVYGLYGRLEFKLCCEIIAAEHGRYGSMEYCGVTKLSTLVHLVHMNRLSACREFCGVHCWQREWHKM